MADGDEEGAHRESGFRAGLQVPEPEVGDAFLVPEHLFDDRVPDEPDLRVVERPLGHDLRGPERVPAVDHVDGGGETGEEEGLFHGGVAAADHRHFPAAVERSVAGGAGRDAAVQELLLRGEAEPAGAGAGGDDHRVGGVRGSGGGHRERPRREVHGVGVHLADLGAEPLGLAAEEVHHFVAGDAVGEARVVLHVGGEHELAARQADVGVHPRSGQQQRLEFGAGGVERRRVSRGAAADDDQAAGFNGHSLPFFPLASASFAAGARLARGRSGVPSARQPRELGEFFHRELLRP